MPIGVVLVALVCLLWAAPVRAQASDEEFSRTLAAAVSEYDRGSYQEAYALFLRLHEERPSARTERALGKAAFELRHYGEAVRWLEASLSDERSPLTPEMRTEVEDVLARARAFVGRITIRLAPADPVGASIDVDGRPLEERTVELDLGDHEIRARAPGFDESMRRVVVRGGESETIEIVLVRRTRDVAVVIAPEDPGTTMRTLGFVSVGLGAALAIGGVIATAIWADVVGTLNANLRTGACVADPSTESIVGGGADCYDQQSRYRLALGLSWGGYASSAAFVGAGIGLVLSAPSAQGERATTALACRPFADLGVSCHGSF